MTFLHSSCCEVFYQLNMRNQVSYTGLHDSECKDESDLLSVEASMLSRLTYAVSRIICIDWLRNESLRLVHDLDFLNRVPLVTNLLQLLIDWLVSILSAILFLIDLCMSNLASIILLFLFFIIVNEKVTEFLHFASSEALTKERHTFCSISTMTYAHLHLWNAFDCLRFRKLRSQKFGGKILPFLLRLFKAKFWGNGTVSSSQIVGVLAH